MAALVAALPRIIIDLLIFTLIHDSTYPNPCFAFQICTTCMHQLYSMRVATDHIYIDLKLSDIGWATKILLPSMYAYKHYTNAVATMRTLRQTCVLAPVTKVAVDRSVMQQTTNYIYVIRSTNVYIYKICFITLLITNLYPSLVRSSSGLLYMSTKNAIICHMEYREALNIIINVSNIEYFNLHTFLTTLLALPRWWWQKWLIHVGN